VVDYSERLNFYSDLHRDQLEQAQTAHRYLLIDRLEHSRASLGFSHITKQVALIAGSWADSGTGLAEQIDSASVCFAARRYPAVVRKSPRQDPVEEVAANTVVDMLGFGSTD